MLCVSVSRLNALYLIASGRVTDFIVTVIGVQNLGRSRFHGIRFGRLAVGGRSLGGGRLAGRLRFTSGGLCGLVVQRQNVHGAHLEDGLAECRGSGRDGVVDLVLVTVHDLDKGGGGMHERAFINGARIMLELCPCVP